MNVWSEFLSLTKLQSIYCNLFTAFREMQSKTKLFFTFAHTDMYGFAKLDLLNRFFINSVLI